jgi:hypothetical protein
VTLPRFRDTELGGAKAYTPGESSESIFYFGGASITKNMNRRQTGDHPEFPRQCVWVGRVMQQAVQLPRRSLRCPVGCPFLSRALAKPTALALAIVDAVDKLRAPEGALNYSLPNSTALTATTCDGSGVI